MKELKNLSSSNGNKLLVVLPVNGKFNDLYINECAYSLAQQVFPVDVVVLAEQLTDEQMAVLKSILDSPKIHLMEKGADEKSERKEVVAEKKLNYVIEHTSSSTFQSIFNEGFNYACINGYEWFSIVEHEDILDISWFENFNKFSEKKNDLHGFLPLTRQVSNGGFVGFFNEACWSEGLGVEVAGVFDLQLLMRFNCMNATGSVFKTNSIKEYSEEKDGLFKPMKESIKISYMHEFFLRMVYNDLKFYTVPRIGYEHRVDTSIKCVDSFSSKVPRDITSRPSDNGGITNEEFTWWSDLAKKEYFFDQDRSIQYTVREK